MELTVFNYAQIDAERIVFAVSQLSAPAQAPDMIQIEAYDSTLIGQRHDLEASAAAGHPVFVPVPAVPAPGVRHISVGAFFDRFGAAKWGILADTTQTVAAVVKDASVRRYIDLDNPDLPAGIALIQQAGHGIDPAAIITAPVQDSERP